MVEEILPGIQADWFSVRPSFSTGSTRKTWKPDPVLLIDLTEDHAEKSEKPLFEVT